MQKSWKVRFITIVCAQLMPEAFMRKSTLNYLEFPHNFDCLLPNKFNQLLHFHFGTGGRLVSNSTVFKYSSNLPLTACRFVIPESRMAVSSSS